MQHIKSDSPAATSEGSRVATSEGSRAATSEGSRVDADLRRSGSSMLLLAIGLILALILGWMVRVILLLLFAAIVFAVLLTAAVDWITSKLKLRRGLAFAIVLGGGSAIAVLTLWILGPKIAQQFTLLQNDLPRAAEQLVSRVRGFGWGSWLLGQLSDYSQLSSNIGGAVMRIGGIVLSTATVIAGLGIVAILGVYLAAEPDVYYQGVRRLVPKRYRNTLDACASSAVRSLQRWLGAQMLSMVAVGTLVTVGLWILGVPLAGTLGIIAALLTFIPNVGPILSAVPAGLLALAISPETGLFTVLLFMLVHLVEGYLITPLLQREIVRLPPALTLTAELLFAVLAGPLGVALASPFLAASSGVLQVLNPDDLNLPDPDLQGAA